MPKRLKKISPSGRRRLNPTKKALMGKKRKSKKRKVRRRRSIAMVKR